MITEALIGILDWLLEQLHGMLPEWSFDPWASSGGQSWDAFWRSMWQWNNFVPIDHMVLWMSTMISLFGVLLIWKFVKWILGVIRGSGTS